MFAQTPEARTAERINVGILDEVAEAGQQMLRNVQRSRNVLDLLAGGALADAPSILTSCIQERVELLLELNAALAGELFQLLDSERPAST